MNDILTIIKRGDELEYDKEVLAELISHRSCSACEVSRDELWYDIFGFHGGVAWRIRMKTPYHDDVAWDNLSDSEKCRILLRKW